MDRFESEFDKEKKQGNWKNSTALHYASHRGYVKVVEALISRGDDVNATNQYGWTPLHYASTAALLAQDDKTVLHLLLQHGADVNHKHKHNHGLTPLHVASLWGDHPDTVDALVEKGASTDDKTVTEYETKFGVFPAGCTPLHLASRMGHNMIVRTLLRLKVDTKSKDSHGKTARDVAKNDKVIDVFDQESEELKTLSEEERQVIKEWEKKLKAENKRGSWRNSTALHYACYTGEVQAVEALLKVGERINYRNQHAWTPLHYAAIGGKGVVSLLLDNGADINPKDSFGVTPLHVATVWGNRADIVDALIKRGAYIDEPTDKDYDTKFGIFPAGCTALHLACRKGDKKAIHTLLHHNADLECQDSEGNTPRDVAKNDEIKRLFDGHDDGDDEQTLSVEEQQLASEWESKLNEQNKRGSWINSTALHYACYTGELRAVDALLKKKENVNGRNQYGWTPLHYACTHVAAGENAIVSLLLQHGADVNLKDIHGVTPLHVASVWGDHSETVSVLVERGAKVNVQTEKTYEIGSESFPTGCTPLHMASRKGRTKVIRTLLHHKADVGCKNNEGKSPKDVAKNDDVRREFGEQSNGEQTISVEEKQLINAWEGMLKEENKRGSWRNSTALHYACYEGDVKATQALIKKGDDINGPNQYGWTPLHYASTQAALGEKDVVNLLLQKGGDVNYKDSHGLTPLHVASLWGDYAGTVDVLIEGGAYVDEPTDKEYETSFGSFPAGSTAIHLASRRGHTTVISALLRHRAYTGCRDSEGKTPREVAKNDETRRAFDEGSKREKALAEEQRQTITELERQLPEWRQTNPLSRRNTTVLHYASSIGNAKVVAGLLARGDDVDVPNWDGKTPLFLACDHGHSEIVSLLIRKGANTNHPSKRGWTPLHISSSNRETAVVAILLKNEADVNLRDNAGWTPLHIACWNGHADVVELLIRHGARTDAKTAKRQWNCPAGSTPLHVASRIAWTDRHIEVIRVLLRQRASKTCMDSDGNTPRSVVCTLSSPIMSVESNIDAIRQLFDE